MAYSKLQEVAFFGSETAFFAEADFQKNADSRHEMTKSAENENFWKNFYCFVVALSENIFRLWRVGEMHRKLKENFSFIYLFSFVLCPPTLIFNFQFKKSFVPLWKHVNKIRINRLKSVSQKRYLSGTTMAPLGLYSSNWVTSMPASFSSSMPERSR